MSEANAIDAAFEDQVQVLFKNLVVNLAEAPVTHKTDQKCLEMFMTGLNLARRAKKMVLTQVQ